jgi:viroplasmin and RNaseH domain-containing protein
MSTEDQFLIKESLKKEKSLCCLSIEELRSPIMMDRIGRLFNKEHILEYLLAKEESLQIVNSLKDLKELKVITGKLKEFCCPVTGKEWNDQRKFLAFWECGCVVSEDAARESLSSNGRLKECFLCGTELNGQKSVIYLTPSKDLWPELMKDVPVSKKKANSSKKRKDQKEHDDIKKKSVRNDPLDSSSSVDIPKILKAKESSQAIQSLYASSKDATVSKSTTSTIK